MTNQKLIHNLTTLISNNYNLKYDNVRDTLINVEYTLRQEQHSKGNMGESYFLLTAGKMMYYQNQLKKDENFSRNYTYGI